MMSLILLIVGVALFFMGRIEIGTLRAEGKHVKTAGVLLALPAVVSFLLRELFIPLAFGSNINAARTFIDIVSVLQLIGVIVVIAIAYILVADPPGAPRLPGLLGEIQDGARKSSKPPQQPSRGKIIDIAAPAAALRPKLNLNRDNFPSVMSLKQAARYLQITEDDVLRLIDEGKITAARDNYHYKIAKSQLDELL